MAPPLGSSFHQAVASSSEAKNIIYDRARHLANQRIAERTRLFHELKKKQITLPQELRAFDPVEDYCYLQLERDLMWNHFPHLSKILNHYVARIRTDLDRFTSVEISALMYHGYTVTEQGLWAQGRNWTFLKQSQVRFRSAEESTDIDWDSWAVSQMETDFLRHLQASGSRNSWWRLLRRLRNRLKNGKFFERDALDVPNSVRRRASRKRMGKPPKNLGPGVGRGLFGKDGKRVIE